MDAIFEALNVKNGVASILWTADRMKEGATRGWRGRNRSEWVRKSQPEAELSLNRSLTDTVCVRNVMSRTYARTQRETERERERERETPDRLGTARRAVKSRLRGKSESAEEEEVRQQNSKTRSSRWTMYHQFAAARPTTNTHTHTSNDLTHIRAKKRENRLFFLLRRIFFYYSNERGFFALKSCLETVL